LGPNLFFPLKKFGGIQPLGEKGINSGNLFKESGKITTQVYEGIREVSLSKLSIWVDDNLTRNS